MTFGSNSETQRKPKTEKDLVPAGPHIGRCYSLVDLGTQKVEYNGEIKLQRKIQMTWELPNKMKVFSEEKGEQPMIVGKKYTASSYGESHLAKDMASWFAGDQPDGDIFQIVNEHVLGRTAVLTVQHDSFEKGTETIHYQKIASVNPLMEGQTCPDQINPSLHFDLDNFDRKCFESLPEWQQNLIKESPEYQVMNKPEGEQADYAFIKELDKLEGNTEEKPSEEMPF